MVPGWRRVLSSLCGGSTPAAKSGGCEVLPRPLRLSPSSCHAFRSSSISSHSASSSSLALGLAERARSSLPHTGQVPVATAFLLLLSMHALHLGGLLPPFPSPLLEKPLNLLTLVTLMPPSLAALSAPAPPPSSAAPTLFVWRQCNLHRWAPWLFTLAPLTSVLPVASTFAPPWHTGHEPLTSTFAPPWLFTFEPLPTLMFMPENSTSWLPARPRDKVSQVLMVEAVKDLVVKVECSVEVRLSVTFSLWPVPCRPLNTPSIC